MAPRKATKQAAGAEVAERVAETGDLSRQKRKKTAAKGALEEGEEIKQARFPRAAKANKAQEIESKDAAEVDVKMDRKPSARSNAADSKKAPPAAKQSPKGLWKRSRIEAATPLEAEDTENDAGNDAEVPAKKSRARVPAKKAGTVAGDERKPKEKERATRNATDNANHTDAPSSPVVKKGRGANKNESVDRNKEKDKVEDETAAVQKKGRMQKKPAAKPAAKKGRGKKEAAVKETDEQKMDSEKPESKEDASDNIENGDKEDDEAKMEATETASLARGKGKVVRKKTDNAAQKKVTKSRAGKATAAASAATVSGDNSEENAEEPAAAKLGKGKQKRTNKDGVAAATTERKMQRKKAPVKHEQEDTENAESDEVVKEEKEQFEGMEVKRENPSADLDDSNGEVQESENDESKITHSDPVNVKNSLTDNDDTE